MLRLLQAPDHTPNEPDDHRRADVRFVVGSDRPVAGLVKDGRFRDDLFRTLNAVTIVMPPLRERREDIPVISQHLFERHSRRLLGRVAATEPGWIDPLIEHEWPGNVRQLENRLVGVVACLRPDEVIDRSKVQAVLAVYDRGTSNSNGCLKHMESLFRRDCLIRALVMSKGSVTHAAEALGMDRSHLYRLINEFDLLGLIRGLNAKDSEGPRSR
jgi:DNA-binding NtrC family response regulator